MIFVGTGMAEMPETCLKCMFYADNGDGTGTCIQTGEEFEAEDFKSGFEGLINGRSENCPLEEIPD